jgi:hypothetical protein
MQTHGHPSSWLGKAQNLFLIAVINVLKTFALLPDKKPREG